VARDTREASLQVSAANTCALDKGYELRASALLLRRGIPAHHAAARDARRQRDHGAAANMPTGRFAGLAYERKPYRGRAAGER
jgi:hypothetical protein